MSQITVNRPPAITWYKLGMNGTQVQLPEGMAYECEVDLNAAPGEAIERTVALTEATIQGAPLVRLTMRGRLQTGSSLALNVRQELPAGVVCIEDCIVQLDAGARVNVEERVLNLGDTYVNFGAYLDGDEAAADFDVRYLGREDAKLDFNYVFEQTAPKTEVEFAARGLLCDASEKIMRDTINLRHGCSGSSGTENESVLILSEQARNKSLPVILCDEDDVVGNHGASIGYVVPEQLMYLGSRGLDEAAIEQLFIDAMIEEARQ